MDNKLLIKKWNGYRSYLKFLIATLLVTIISTILVGCGRENTEEAVEQETTTVMETTTCPPTTTTTTASTATGTTAKTTHSY